VGGVCHTRACSPRPLWRYAQCGDRVRRAGEVQRGSVPQAESASGRTVTPVIRVPDAGAVESQLPPAQPPWRPLEALCNLRGDLVNVRTMRASTRDVLPIDQTTFRWGAPLQGWRGERRCIVRYSFRFQVITAAINRSYLPGC
jgi:hypothetical protein